MRKVIISVAVLLFISAYGNAKSVGGGLGLNVFEEGAGASFIVWYGGDNRLGWIVSLNTNFKNKDRRDDYYDSIDAAQAEGWGDDLQSSADALSSWCIGAMYRLFTGFDVYGGIGAGNKTEFLKYCDDTHILGDGGMYWIEGESESSVNLSCGIMYRIPEKSCTLFAGGNTFPQSFYAGIGYLFHL